MYRLMILESIFIDYSRENYSGDGLVFWQWVNLSGSFKDNCVTGLVKVCAQTRFVCAKSALKKNDEQGRKKRGKTGM